MIMLFKNDIKYLRKLFYELFFFYFFLLLIFYIWGNMCRWGWNRMGYICDIGDIGQLGLCIFLQFF